MLRAQNAVIFENRYSERAPVFLPEHRVYGTIVAPAASHVAAALTVGVRLYKQHVVALEDVLFPEALMIQEGEVPYAAVRSWPGGGWSPPVPNPEFPRR